MLKLHKTFISKSDQTQKMLWKTEDNYFFESVLYQFENRQGICLSSQIGCPFSCKFCTSGMIPFIRNLSSDEIMEQILLIKTKFSKKGQVNFINFMGIGEPFLNTKNVFSCIDRIYLESFATMVSISSIGIKNSINDIVRYILKTGCYVQLQLSVHAPTDKMREDIFGFKPPLDIKSMMKYSKEMYKISCEMENRGRHEGKVKFKYMLINGINDSDSDIETIAQICNDCYAKLLISPVNTSNTFQASNIKTVEHVEKILKNNHVDFMIESQSSGLSINAGCGQLVYHEK